MKKRMIIVTALIMGTLGAGCVSVQASDTLPELTKDPDNCICSGIPAQIIKRRSDSSQSVP